MLTRPITIREAALEAKRWAWGPSLLAILLAWGTLALAASQFSFPFLADDWLHLANASEHGHPRLLPEQWARVPVWAAIAHFVMRPEVWAAHFWPLYVALALHCIGAVLIIHWVAKRGTPLLWAQASPAFLALVYATFAIYPGHYEILYWPTCMPYTLGTVLLAAALWARPLWLRVSLLALSYLTYEAFIFASLALLLLPVVLRLGESRSGSDLLTELRPVASAVGLAVIVWAVARYALAQWLGAFEHQVRFEVDHAIAQLAHGLRLLMSVHFYAPDKLLTLLQAAVLLALAVSVVRLGRGRSLSLLLALVLIVGSMAHYLVLAYGAPRALYGSALVLTALGATLAVLAAGLAKRRTPVILMLSLLAGGYLTQTLQIFRIKDANAQVLAQREDALVQQARRCTDEPCRLTLGRPDAGLSRDWILPENVWAPYVRLLEARVRERSGVDVSIDVRAAEPAP